jgi:glycosyltransferase involved in cell wall biosynthesis
MKVVYFISGLQSGGAQTGLKRIISNIDHKKYDFCIITLNASIDDPKNWPPRDCELLDLKISEYSKLYRLSKLWDELGKADILVCSLYDASLIGRIVGSLHSETNILDWRHNTSFQNGWRRLTFNLTAWMADTILADSKAVIKSLKKEPGTLTTPIRQIPIAGIDTEKFRPHDGNKPEDAQSVVSVMRVAEQKNPQAMIELAQRFEDESVSFDIAGEGPLLEAMNQQIKKSDLDNIEFHGFIENLPSFLQRGDIYVQSSKSEGLCITVPEAMSCGLPVVGSAVGGITESVVDGETGYLVQPTDLDGFENRIRDLLHNPTLRSQFGRKGRKRVKEHYSQEVLISEFERAIEDVAESSGQAPIE